MLAVTSPEFSLQREKRTEEIFRGGINGCDGSTFFAARDKGVVFRINSTSHSRVPWLVVACVHHGVD